MEEYRRHQTVIPEPLIEALQAQKCTLFLGPGILTHGGFPNRLELLETLVTEAVALSEATQTELIQMIRESWTSGSFSLFDEVGEILIGNVGRAPIADGIRRMFRLRRPRITPLFRMLGTLPFQSVLTMNWDRITEQVFQPKRPIILTGSINDDLKAGYVPEQFLLVKLYGELDDSSNSNFRFTSDDFRLFLNANAELARLIASIVKERSLLFVGANLPSIQNFFTSLPSKPETTREHFALVPEKEFARSQVERFKSRFNVTIVDFRPGKDFSGLDEVVSEIKSRIQLPQQSIVATPSQQRQLLKRLRLRNIGAFQDMEMQVGADWTILLGNNGVGKSTILKSIALGLCGDDPQSAPTASSLLRDGAKVGNIELLLGDVAFETSLIREGDSVFVKCSQVTPLQRGDAAAIGFPPLRAMPSRQSNSLPSSRTSVDSSRPTIDDLLPLLVGSVDNRMESLRSWFVFLSARAQSKGNKTQLQRMNQQRDSFVKIVRELLPGTRIENIFVRMDSMDVYVTTPDGNIPIDQISQGMTSILGWVGTTLQRLYEVYPNSREPEKESILILVDEIEAHLHPEWQRDIVPLVKRYFPNAQVLATSHSPLIVAGMKSTEVFIVQRDPSGSVYIEPAPTDLEGLRADQILTSPLFGLTSTRSPQSMEAERRYTALLSMPTRSESEQAEFERLQTLISTKHLSSESAIGRKAEITLRQMIKSSSASREKYEQLTSEERKEVLAHLQGLVGTSDATAEGEIAEPMDTAYEAAELETVDLPDESEGRAL